MNMPKTRRDLSHVISARPEPSVVVFQRHPARVAAAVALLHSESPQPSTCKTRIWQISMDDWRNEADGRQLQLSSTGRSS